MKNLVAVVGLMIVGFFAWKANGQGLANVTLESGLPVTGSLLPTSNTYGGNLQARSIYTDGAGNIFLAGSATSNTFSYLNVFYSGGSGTVNPGLANSVYFYIFKYNSAGAPQSGIYIFSNVVPNGADIIDINGITGDASGNIYITGVFRGTMDFSSGVSPGTSSITSVGTTGDAFVAKYTSAFALSWVKRIGPAVATTNRAIPQSIAISPATGHVWISGYATGNGTDFVDLDPGAGTSNIDAIGINNVAFISGYNSSTGVFLSRAFAENNSLNASSAHVVGSSLAINSTGKIYAVGDFITSMYAIPGSATLTTTTNAKAGFVWMYDPVALTCTLTAESDNNQYFDVSIDGSDNVFAGGKTLAAGLLVKYNSSLAKQWTRNPGLQINSVDIDNSGMVYCAGNTPGEPLFVQKYTTAGVVQYGANGFTIPVVSYVGFYSQIRNIELSGTNLVIGGIMRCGTCTPDQDIGFDAEEIIAVGGAAGVNDQFWGIYRYDNVGATGTVTSTASSPTNVSPIPITVTFDEPVIGFVPADHDIVNATVSNVIQVNNKTYTFNLMPTVAQGSISYQVFTGMFDDYHKNLNLGSNLFSTTYDAAPTVVVSTTSAEPTGVSPIPVTFTFSESVTGFIVGDITVTNGTAGSFAGSGASYTANITPSGAGTVTVSVAANKATDAGTNGNLASNTLTRTYNIADTTPPTVTLTSNASDPTKISPIPITITFNEAVTGFVVGDIGVVNGSAGTFAGSGTTYTANITPTGQGIVTVSVAANVAIDAATNGNTSATNLTRVFDNVEPTVVISSTTASTTSVTPIPVTFTFNEAVTGFAMGDIGVTGGSIGNFAGSGTIYTADITPSGPGTVTVSVAANIAIDAATNGNTVANNLVRTYSTADTTPPTIIISSTSSNPTNITPIPVTFTFNEVVTGFVVGDIGVVNGSAGAFAGSGTTYTANITPTGPGTVTVSVAANVATDAAANGNTISTNLTRMFDNVAPTVIISSSASGTTSVSPIPVTVTFNESITGFVVGDIVVGNGSAGNFAGSGAVYTADITPSGSGAVTVNVASSVASDAAGNGNSSATQFSITYTPVSGTTQFATSVIGFSSQYSTPNYSAEKALLANDVYPSYADSPNAWTHGSPDGQREFIKLGFTTPMNVFKIEIYETYVPGSVDTVYLRNASTGLWNQVYSTSAASAGSTARILTISIAQTSYLVDAIRIAMNSPVVVGWNEIDAVAITGVAGVDTSPPTITITSTASNPTNVTPIPVTFTFNEAVTGFIVGDIGVVNGSAGNFAGSGTTYTANITPTGQGTVTVSVASNVATDAATNGNTAATNLTRVFDNVAPTVTITSSSTDPTNISPIPVTITFSEAVTGFVVGDIGVIGGSIGNFAGSGTTYTADITPSGSGTVTVSVVANVAVDAATNGNTVAINLTRVFDNVAPTVTITSSSTDPTNISPIPVTIMFNETVTGFVVGDIGVVNGTAGAFAGSGTTYTADITPSGSGTVTVSVVANVAVDAATNGNTVATNLTRVFDNVAPTVTITSSSTDPTNISPIPVTIIFSESVTGFVVGDITVANGTAGNFAGSGLTYTADITPSGVVTVSVSVAASKATDGALNNNVASNTLTRVYNNTSPTVTISSIATDPTNVSPIPITVTFSESVTGFIVGDIIVTNGTAGTFAGSGTSYTANITPTGAGAVTASVAANSAVNTGAIGNTASNLLTRTYDTGAPSVTITSSAIDPTNISPIPVTITFSESVTGFVVGDIGVVNGTAGVFAGSGTTYTANITPSGQGMVTVSVAANVANDAATNGNIAGVNLTRVYDNVAPTVTISSSATDPTNVSLIPVTITFSESVTGFVVGDIGVVNGTTGNLAGSGTTYTANITPTGQGMVTVSVAANVAKDAATNGNSAATNLTRVYDNVVPTVTITSSATDPTNISPIPIAITFSESVIGFDATDISVTNGTAGTFAGSGTTYTANITPSGQGTVTVGVAGALASDAAGNTNTAASNLTRNFTGTDTTAPTVVISSVTADPTNVSLIPITITFSESVMGFVVEDIGVVNGTAGTFAGSGTTYTANITPTGQGTVTVSVATNVAIDVATNGNTAATNLTRVFDNIAPTVTITSSSTDPTNVSPIPVTITFSESVIGFDINDISMTNGTAGTFAGSGTTYTANITPAGQGAITLSVAANVASDAAANGNTAATNLTRVYDNVAPTVTITSSSTDPTNVSPIPVTITFSESVIGFDVNDISMTNGTAGTFAGSGATYTANITPTGTGVVTVSVAANKATDAAINNNAASNILSRTYQTGGAVNQTITFDAIANKSLGDGPFNLSATASSGLAVSFSSASDKITISGTLVTLAKAGSVTVSANQAGNASFNVAPSVDRIFCISPAKPSIAMSGADTETVVLTSSSAVGNQWFKEGSAISGATAGTLNITAAGVYSVQVTIESCPSAKSNDFPVVVTGLEMIASSKLYPNPASEQIIITIPGGNGGKIQLADLRGVHVFALESQKAQEEINVQTFSAGIYFVTITTSKGVFRTRFIKN